MAQEAELARAKNFFMRNRWARRVGDSRLTSLSPALSVANGPVNIPWTAPPVGAAFVPRLIEGLQDDNHGVRVACAKSLKIIGTAKAITAVQEWKERER